MMQKLLLREGEKVNEKMRMEGHQRMIGAEEDDELVSDDVVGGTAELATGRLTLELTSSPRKSLLGPPQTPLNPLETLSN
jgi:hypothetical protein